MNDDEFDEMIRKELKRQEPPLPASYIRRMDELMEELQEKSRLSKRKKYLKVAVIFFMCMTMGATSVYAAVNLYRQRMNSISPSRVSDINEDVQSSDENADGYSRKLSQKEINRMDSLAKQYVEGTMPKQEIKQVDKEAEVLEGQFCYCYENSTFYLPQTELTDEQLLEIVDLQQIRDFALQKENDPEKATAIKEKITEEEAKKAASEFVKNVYRMDLKTAQIDAKFAAGNYEKKIDTAVYEITITDTKWENGYYFDINSETGDIIALNFTNEKSNIDLNKETKVTRKQYVEYGEKLGATLKYLTKQKTFTHIEMSYVSNEKKSLYQGIVKYYAYDENDAGDVLIYNTNINQISNVYSFENIKSYKKGEKEDDKVMLEDGYKRTHLKIK